MTPIGADHVGPAHKLLRFDGQESLARGAAAAWIAWTTKPACLSDRYRTVALSGGRIAERFFDAVVAGAAADPEPFRALHYFWADERCVDPANENSNYRVAAASLLRPLEVPASNIHRVRGELEPAVAASLASRELQFAVPSREAGRAVLDLVLLGMGEDGHVASLFPGESEDVADDVSGYRAVLAPKPPPQRVTLDYLPLVAAKEVWVLVSGAGKADALHRSLSGDQEMPLGKLLRRRWTTKIFSDI